MKEVKLRVYIKDNQVRVDCENCNNELLKLAAQQFDKINQDADKTHSQKINDFDLYLRIKKLDKIFEGFPEELDKVYKKHKN